jgi:hypothetical protein
MNKPLAAALVQMLPGRMPGEPARRPRSPTRPPAGARGAVAHAGTASLLGATRAGDRLVAVGDHGW